jgi:hypothetical protein
MAETTCQYKNKRAKLSAPPLSYSYYFTGIFSRTALRNSQHFATEGMFARSSGE